MQRPLLLSALVRILSDDANDVPVGAGPRETTRTRAVADDQAEGLWVGVQFLPELGREILKSRGGTVGHAVDPRKSSVRHARLPSVTAKQAVLGSNQRPPACRAGGRMWQ